MGLESVGDIFNHSPPAHTYSSGSILVDQTTRLGVEFEFEGVNKAPDVQGGYNSLWAQKEDGSLRGAGREFVFAAPMFGKDAEAAITWLVSEATRLKYKTSIRTGLHVHLDVREMTPQQFVNLALIYALAEPFLFWWAGKPREESAFCVPWYYATKTTKTAGGILKAVKDTDGATTARLYSETFERYSALNFNALSRFGSIEFRHMEQTLNLKKIFSWINLLLSMKLAAVKHPKLSSKLLNDPYTFLVTVFGDKAEELKDFTREPLKAAFLKGRKTYIGLETNLKALQGGWEDFGPIRVAQPPQPAAMPPGDFYFEYNPRR